MPTTTHPAIRPHDATPRPARIAVTVGAPLVLAAVLLIHPADPMGFVDGAFDRWFFVHEAMILLTPLLGAAGWLLTAGLPGLAATLARWALFPFLVFYPAWEALAGLGTGQVVAILEPGAGADVVNHPVLVDWWAWAGYHWLMVLGVAAWTVFTIGAAIAHHRAGAPMPVVVGLVVATTYPILHAGPPASIPLLALALVGLMTAITPAPRRSPSGDLPPADRDTSRERWR